MDRYLTFSGSLPYIQWIATLHPVDRYLTSRWRVGLHPVDRYLTSSGSLPYIQWIVTLHPVDRYLTSSGSLPYIQWIVTLHPGEGLACIQWIVTLHPGEGLAYIQTTVSLHPGSRYLTSWWVLPFIKEIDSLCPDPIVGLVVKTSVSRAEDPEFESCLRRDFSGSSHTSDFKIGTPVATLPGAWR